MVMAFPKYESYKDSGEDWIGEVPEHWDVLRTKNVFRLVAEPAPKNNDEELLSVYSDIGVKPRRELEERGNKASTTDGYWIVKKGDVIVNKLLAWMGAIGVSDYDGVTSPAYDILRARKPIDSKFYHYLFRTQICIDKLKKHSKGIMEMRLRLYFDEFGNIKIPYPSIKEQNRIVDFLDRITNDIDQAIAKKQRLIELLNEQKAILINRAVTKGLNPNAPMRDSGIEWIGEIPEHWDIKKICRISKVVRGASPRPAGDPKYFSSDKGTCWVTVAEITKDEDLYLTSTKEFLTDAGVKQSQLFIKNTVVLTNSGATLGVPKILALNCCANDGVVIFQRLSNEIEREFLYFYLYSQTYRLREEIKQGSGQPNLNTDIVKNIPITLPKIEEQLSIISFIKELIANQQCAREFIEKQILVIQEYKQTIIANAVTGKIKV